MTIDEATRLALADEATFQSLGPGEGAVLLRVDSGQLYSCNDTAAALIEALATTDRFGALIDRLADRFEVDRSRLREDLEELVATLDRAGLVRIAQ